MTKKTDAEAKQLAQEKEEKAAKVQEDAALLAEMEAEDAKAIEAEEEASKLDEEHEAATEASESDIAELDVEQKDIKITGKCWVLKQNLKRNGLFYAKGKACPESKLTEFGKLGFIKEV
jgi:hypothetical protein